MSQKKCFVIGPIGDEGSDERRHADWLLDGIVAPVVHQYEFGVLRSDRISSPGMIDSQIINLVSEADLVIADLTYRNANAFYELAIRHMEEKPIIHMIHKSQVLHIPFDVKPFRTVTFSWDNYKDLEQSKIDLKSHIEAIVSTDYKVDNPVTRARGYKNLQKTATPVEQVMFKYFHDQLLKVYEQFGELEAKVTSLSERPSSMAAAFGALPVRTGSITNYSSDAALYTPITLRDVEQDASDEKPDDK